MTACVPSPAVSSSNLGTSHDFCQSSPALAPLNDLAHGGYAGVRLGEARNPGPATHERDRAAEERNARQRRVNEAGTQYRAVRTLLYEESVHNLRWVAQRKVPQIVERTGVQPLIPRSSGNGTHPTSAESAEAARAAWSGGKCRAARGAMREQGRSKTGIASLPHAKLAPTSVPRPTGERQEHLDAIVSFAGAGQRRRLFRRT